MALESIDKLVKEKFYTIYNKAKNDAESIFIVKYLPKYQHLPLYDQILFLQTESDLLEVEGDNTLNSVYFHNHRTEEWLLKAFSSRTVILNIDESDSLYNCVVAGTLESKLSQLYYDLSASLPRYSYDDFLAKKYNRYFFEMELFSITSEEDYFKIRAWQADKLISIVNTEAKLIVDTFRKSLNQDPSTFQHLDSLKVHYDWLFVKSDFSSPKELISELQIFSFLKGYDFNLLDNADSVLDFNCIVDNINIFRRFTPDFIDSIRSRYRSSKYHPAFSISPIIYFSISRVIFWIEKVIETKNINIPYEIIDYHKLFNQTCDAAKKEAEILFEQFDESNNVKSLVKEELLKLYRKKIESLRQEYKQEGLFHHYFTGDSDYKKLAFAFKIRSFIYGDEIDNIAYLKKAIILNDGFYEYLGCIYEITGKKLFAENYQGANYLEITYLLHNMVLDSDLYKRMNDLMFKTISIFQKTIIPFEIIQLNLAEGMIAIFNECIDRLLKYLENCEGSNKVLYVHTRLKQLKQRELELKRHKFFDFERDTSKYTTLFKEYLEIEADYIRDTKDISIIPSLAFAPNPNQIDKPKKQPPKTQNSYTLIDLYTKSSKLTDFFNSLKGQGFISDKTNLAAFRKIFTNQLPAPPIIWTGSLEELDYLIKYLHLIIKVIEPIKRNIWLITSNCFYDNQEGIKFNPENLGKQHTPKNAKLLQIAADNLK